MVWVINCMSIAWRSCSSHDLSTIWQPCHKFKIFYWDCVVAHLWYTDENCRDCVVLLSGPNNACMHIIPNPGGLEKSKRTNRKKRWYDKKKNQILTEVPCLGINCPCKDKYSKGWQTATHINTWSTCIKFALLYLPGEHTKYNPFSEIWKALLKIIMSEIN